MDMIGFKLKGEIILAVLARDIKPTQVGTVKEFLAMEHRVLPGDIAVEVLHYNPGSSGRVS